MDTYQKHVLIFVFVVLATNSSAQTERWVYRYSGINTYRDDEAHCLVYGGDGNIYAGGYTNNDITNRDFTVISLTNMGEERWVYKYLTVGNNWDECYSICYGNDGNIYTLGDCTGSDSVLHFTIISLTTEGTERWVYQYPNLSYGRAICYGNDGNIYAVGSTQGKILVVSLDINGNERWTYVYNTPSGESGHGMSIVNGLDGNIYVTGYTGLQLNKDVVVISLNPVGSERWVYLYDGSGSHDYGMSIINHPDGNLYVFGCTCDEVGPYLYSDGLVISLTNSGDERWTYTSVAVLSEFESGVYDAEGNLYAVGAYGWDIPFFLIESISDSATCRWQYIDTTWGFGTSIVYGAEGNIYAGGITSDTWQGGETYFSVLNFTNGGGLSWIYRKPGWGNYGDIAFSVAYGLDGNIYAAGTICDSITWSDFAVISLGPTGIEEDKKLKVKDERLKLIVSPIIIRDEVRIQYTIFKKQHICLDLYDILGRQIKTIAHGIFKPGSYIYNLSLSNISSDIYFVVLTGENERRVKKIMIVR